MALRLRIISEHRRLLGERSTVTFGAAGGLIGRSADNDWVLPDPQRFVSAHHARIAYRGGHYFLEDISTNGTFVNDDERPLAKVGAYRLQSGDVLRIGEYQLVAALEVEAPASSPQASQAQSSGSATAPDSSRVSVLQSVGRAAQTDLGAALNLDDLLLTDGALEVGVAESPSGSQLGPVNAYGQAIVPRSMGGAPAVAESVVESEEQQVARRMERLARAIRARDAAHGVSLPALYDVQSGLVAFCRGAGIDAEQMPADAQTRLLHLAGQLFREALVGLKDLERGRHEIHNRFRVELSTDPDDPRPSLARSTIEELLIQLLLHHEGRRVDAVQWLREIITGSKAHERAMIEAMRAAFIDFISRLDPVELEARFQRTTRRGKAANNEARYWQLFVEFYRNLTEMPADHLPHTFVETFATAYKEALLKPAPPTT